MRNEIKRTKLTGNEIVGVFAAAAGAVAIIVSLNSSPDSGRGDTSRNGGNPGPQTISTGLGADFGR